MSSRIIMSDSRGVYILVTNNGMGGRRLPKAQAALVSQKTVVTHYFIALCASWMVSGINPSQKLILYLATAKSVSFYEIHILHLIIQILQATRYKMHLLIPALVGKRRWSGIYCYILSPNKQVRSNITRAETGIFEIGRVVLIIPALSSYTSHALTFGRHAAWPFSFLFLKQ